MANPQTPPQTPAQAGCLGKTLAVGGVAASFLWLLNFTVGVFEIPDVLPIVGSIDEAIATGVFLASLRYLGIDLLPFGSKRHAIASVIRPSLGAGSAMSRMPNVEVLETQKKEDVEAP